MELPVERYERRLFGPSRKSRPKEKKTINFTKSLSRNGELLSNLLANGDANSLTAVTCHVPAGHKIDLIIDGAESVNYFTTLHFSFVSAGSITMKSTPIPPDPTKKDT